MNSENRDHILLGIILLAAGILRFDFLFIERVVSDEGLYLWYAAQIFEEPSRIFSAELSRHHPPLFPLMLATARSIIPSDLAYRIVPFLFYLVGIVAIYCMGKRIAGSSLGILSAFLLAFHPVYFNISTGILIDAPVMVMCILYALGLESLSRNTSVQRQCLVGSLAAVTLGLKSYGVGMLLVTIVVLHKDWRKVPVFILTLGVIGVLSVFHCLRVRTASFDLTPPVDRDGLTLLLHNIMDLGQYLKIEGLLTFFTIGVLFQREQLKHWAPILYLWILGFFIIFLSVGIRFEYRFGLLFLPPVTIIAGLGILKTQEISRKAVRNNRVAMSVAASLFVAAIGWIFMTVYPYMVKNSYQSTGYAEAGEVIKKIVKNDALVLAGSERQIRNFSGLNFVKHGGNIVALRQTRPELERMFRDHEGQILLEVDRWEIIQPRWLTSLSDENLKHYLHSQGFHLRHAVHRLLALDDGGFQFIVAPVIFIFERTSEGQ